MTSVHLLPTQLGMCFAMEGSIVTSYSPSERVENVF